MIALLFTLLLAGTVEAGGVDLRNLPPSGGTIDESIVRDMYVRAGGQTPSGDWKQIRVDKDGYVLPSPCHQRMQEAMRAADAYLLNPAPYMPPKTVEEREERYRIRKQVGEQWDQTMKDCVK